MEITSKKQLHFVLKADYLMNRGKLGPSLVDRVKNIFFPDYIMVFLSSMRKVSYYNYKSGFFYKVLFIYYYFKYRKMKFKLGFNIGYNTLGYGAIIPHHGTIVIGSSNRIGNFAVLHTSTCITDNGKIIGDGLYLSTGVKITSKIILGNNISIGANSLVNKNFEEDNILIGGMPAKKIKEALPWYIRDHFQERVERVNSLKCRYKL